METGFGLGPGLGLGLALGLGLGLSLGLASARVSTFNYYCLRVGRLRVAGYLLIYYGVW